MERDGTGERAGTGQSLVALSHDTPPRERQRSGGRPIAGFLTQLIVEAEPGLRPSRRDRMRDAAALYAQAARRA